MPPPPKSSPRRRRHQPRLQARAIQISGTIGNHTRKLGKDWVVNLAGSDHALEITEGTGNTRVSLASGTELVLASDWLPGQTLATVDIGGDTLAVKVDLKAPPSGCAGAAWT